MAVTGSKHSNRLQEFCLLVIEREGFATRDTVGIARRFRDAVAACAAQDKINRRLEGDAMTDGNIDGMNGAGSI